MACSHTSYLIQNFSLSLPPPSLISSGRVLCSLGWFQIHYIGEAGLELLILLLPPHIPHHIWLLCFFLVRQQFPPLQRGRLQQRLEEEVAYWHLSEGVLGWLSILLGGSALAQRGLALGTHCSTAWACLSHRPLLGLDIILLRT